MVEIKGNIRNVTQKLTGNIKSIGAAPYRKCIAQGRTEVGDGN